MMPFCIREMFLKCIVALRYVYFYIVLFLTDTLASSVGSICFICSPSLSREHDRQSLML
jgi:hypothetical protein